MTPSVLPEKVKDEEEEEEDYDEDASKKKPPKKSKYSNPTDDNDDKAKNRACVTNSEAKSKTLAKTYYRRGVGYSGKREWDNARNDFEESLKIDPSVYYFITQPKIRLC